MIVSLCALPSMPLSLLFNSNVCSNLKSSFRMSLAFLPRSLYFGGAMSANPNGIPHQRYMHRHPKTNTRTAHCQESHENSGKRATPPSARPRCTRGTMHRFVTPPQQEPSPHTEPTMLWITKALLAHGQACWRVRSHGHLMPGGCASSLRPASASCPCA